MQGSVTKGNKTLRYCLGGYQPDFANVMFFWKTTMGIKQIVWKAVKWRYMKNHLEYDDEQMEKFKNNPKNHKLLSKVPNIMSKTIVAEVFESHGCNSEHKVGEKFHFDGLGNLLVDKSPKKICIYALNAIVPQIFAATELLLAGQDPNEMQFNRAACFDVGVQCGGFGRIVLEVKVIDGQSL